MSFTSSYPTISELLTEASLNPTRRQTLDVAGTPVAIYLQPDRIHVYRDNDPEPFATLRFGGPHSGAIWIDGEVAGEYEKDSDGRFIITEIDSGFRMPDSRRERDPVRHILEVLRDRMRETEVQIELQA